MPIKLSASMEYIPDKGMRRLAERVAIKYPELFEHIDLDRVLFYREVTGKASGAAGICRKISTPYRQILRDLGLDAEFIIEFYSASTEGKSKEWEAILMFHELQHIGEDGKLVEHDVEDFYSVLNNVGVDWTADRNLPDILKKKIEL